jgi:hypothetical protein
VLTKATSNLLEVSELRVDSWSNELVVRQSPAGKDVSKEEEDIAGIRYQATAGKVLACAVMRNRVRELVRSV